MCLQNALEDSNKSLQPDCYKMLTTRMEMFKNAAKVCKRIPLYISISFFFVYFGIIVFYLSHYS